MKTITVNKGENLILNVMSSTFHEFLSDSIETISCYDETTNKKVYNTVNKQLYFTEENGRLTIPNLITEAHTYRRTVAAAEDRNSPTCCYISR